MTTFISKRLKHWWTNISHRVGAVIVFGAAGLAGCNGGGGDGDGGTTPPPPPNSGITLFAGALGGAGNADGTLGRLAAPSALSVDSKGAVFVADLGNCNVRKIVGTTVSTFFGGNSCVAISPSGELLSNTGAATFAITTDSADNVYVRLVEGLFKIAPDGTRAPNRIADSLGGFDRYAFDQANMLITLAGASNAIYQVGADGTRTLIAGGNDPLDPAFPYADGTGAAAKFHSPRGLAIGNDGVIYIADTLNHAIRKVTRAGVVTTLAGLPTNRGSADGVGASAQFNEPSSIALDAGGNVYVADSANYTVRKITPAGVVTTVAGAPGVRGALDGAGAAARFQNVSSIGVDKSGAVFVADEGNNTVRRISPEGTVTTVAGVLPSRGNADGTGAAARFSSPNGLAIDTTGNVYVADTDNATIRKISSANAVSTLAGDPARQSVCNVVDGTGAAARFCNPVGIAVDAAGNSYVTEEQLLMIRKVSAAGQVTTIKSLPRGDGRFPLSLSSVAVDGASNIYYISISVSIPSLQKLTPAGIDSNISCGVNCKPNAVTTDNAGNVYVAANGTIKRIAPDGTVLTLAGDASVERLGSTDGTGAAARFYNPLAIATDNKGNIFVADTGNHTVRKVTSAGVVTTIAGKAGVSGATIGALPGLLNSPRGIVIDSAGNLYVSTENAVVKITL
jgi:sugar lactone lactonase YvrE